MAYVLKTFDDLIMQDIAAYYRAILLSCFVFTVALMMVYSFLIAFILWATAIWSWDKSTEDFLLKAYDTLSDKITVLLSLAMSFWHIAVEALWEPEDTQDLLLFYRILVGIFFIFVTVVTTVSTLIVLYVTWSCFTELHHSIIKLWISSRESVKRIC